MASLITTRGLGRTQFTLASAGLGIVVPVVPPELGDAPGNLCVGIRYATVDADHRWAALDPAVRRALVVADARWSQLDSGLEVPDIDPDARYIIVAGVRLPTVRSGYRWVDIDTATRWADLGSGILVPSVDAANEVATVIPEILDYECAPIPS